MNLLYSKYSLIIILVLQLTACETTQTRSEVEEQPQLNLAEIIQQAEEAYENDDLVNGEKNYEILVREMPQDSEYWFRLANIYVRTDRPYASINLYREAVIRDPSFSKAWYNLSVVQLKQTAFSLSEMLLYADKSDPLFDKAFMMLEDIKAIIQK